MQEIFFSFFDKRDMYTIICIASISLEIFILICILTFKILCFPTTLLEKQILCFLAILFEKQVDKWKTVLEDNWVKVIIELWSLQ